MSNSMVGAIALSALAAAFAPAKADGDPLAQYRWRSRVVVAIAASASDPALAAQRQVFAAMAPGARERDLVLVEASDDTPTGRTLRARFGGTGFRAVLLGKDGGAKLTADHPLGPDELFPLIDTMPMRQDEMQKSR